MKTYDELVDLARSVGIPEDQLDTCAAIALAESGGNPSAVGDTKITDEKWGPSIGLWQIRSLRADANTGRERDASRLLEATFNAQSMAAIYRKKGWSPWGAYTNESYKEFLKGQRMGCTPAPTCKAALAEATRLWPNRRKTSDGICGDPRHQARRSDHNSGNAWDLSHDPANGCDAHAIVEGIRQRQDSRVKYIISNRRICGPGAAGGGWHWRPYSGSNAHTSHTHVSIYAHARNDTRPWFTAEAQPAPSPAPAPTDDKHRPYPGGNGYRRNDKQKSPDGNVRWIQDRLNGTNLQPKLKADGFFGASTDRAVRGFQGAVRLKQDGIVGPGTWDHLKGR